VYYVYCGSICDSFLETERQLVGQTLDGGQRKAIHTRKKLQLIQCDRSSRKMLMVGEKFEAGDEKCQTQSNFETIPSPPPSVGSCPGVWTSETCSSVTCWICFGWLCSGLS